MIANSNPNLSFNAPINQTSYGIASKAILRELDKKYDVSLFNIDPRFQITEDEQSLILKTSRNAEKFDYNATCLRIYHQFSLHEMPRCNKRIGFPIFELPQFHDHEVHSMQSCDELFVASTWGKECLTEWGINIPITVTPLGVDTSVFKPEDRRGEIFTIFNIGKNEVRKGHDIIPLILNEAFRKDDKFLLRMMWRSQFTEMTMGDELLEWESLYRQELNNRVEFCPQVKYNSEVANFINSGHIGLFPFRAEGFLLPLLESMACGKMVIATNYSAPTEYAHVGNCFLVKPTEMESAYDGNYFHGFGTWAKVDNLIKQYAEYLRFIYEEWKKGNDIINYSGCETAKKFSWENTVNQMEGRF